ncbi:hypothetical protein BFP72_09805 [Reichenbachiella sp. 5M10]|uniref:ABC transporter substrate-binding protein n=1 Tax=Reichenbachiella sp. 5M10 TaxID=1889772 RepID=UPI000C155D17|nr:ABC transporter substrate-binding protein [Reichenbachiella sp. 5M10]PIB35665.1 hypothetical protein BFP72_09805 [Reichenbachiella sp. 5M10]
MKQAILLTCLVVLAACQPQEKPTTETNETGAIQYAERFTLDEYDGYKVLKVNQLYQGSEESMSYLLYEGELPQGIDVSQYVPVQCPVKRIISNSTTHVAFLEILGLKEELVGFAQSQYIYSEEFNKRLEEGKLEEIGSEGKLDIERVLSLRPDVILAFSAGGENRQLEKLQELGQKVVYMPDYLEPTVLGRAEWIKFIGYLVGKEKVAEAYFEEVAMAYDSLLALVSEVERPSVFSGSLYGGSWFMPAGHNYNGLMIQDAGGDYLWSDNSQNGWLNLDFEAVYAKANRAEYWIGAANYESLEKLEEADERYAEFGAFQAGEVYTYTKRLSANGGNDYFESGNANPHLLLADHIKVIHPELLPDYELFYYKQLE